MHISPFAQLVPAPRVPEPAHPHIGLPRAQIPYHRLLLWQLLGCVFLAEAALQAPVAPAAPAVGVPVQQLSELPQSAGRMPGSAVVPPGQPVLRSRTPQACSNRQQQHSITQLEELQKPVTANPRKAAAPYRRALEVENVTAVVANLQPKVQHIIQATLGCLQPGSGPCHSSLNCLLQLKAAPGPAELCQAHNTKRFSSQVSARLGQHSRLSPAAVDLPPDLKVAGLAPPMAAQAPVPAAARQLAVHCVGKLLPCRMH